MEGYLNQGRLAVERFNWRPSIFALLYAIVGLFAVSELILNVAGAVDSLGRPLNANDYVSRGICGAFCLAMGLSTLINAATAGSCELTFGKVSPHDHRATVSWNAKSLSPTEIKIIAAATLFVVLAGAIFWRPGILIAPVIGFCVAMLLMSDREGLSASPEGLRILTALAERMLDWGTVDSIIIRTHVRGFMDFAESFSIYIRPSGSRPMRIISFPSDDESVERLLAFCFANFEQVTAKQYGGKALNPWFDNVSAIQSRAHPEAAPSQA